MTIYYSASSGGFYSSDIHGGDVPADSVAVTEEEHAALLEGQSQGGVLSADANGRPVIRPFPESTAEQRSESARRARLAAYVAEADPLFFLWQRGESTEQAWLDKIAEIKARFPKE